MIISAWECECRTYHKKLTSNLLRIQLGLNYKKEDTAFEITTVKRKCQCGKTKSVKVLGA